MKPRLLVIELHHLGDAVVAIPFLRAAAAFHEVRVFCTPGVAEMLREFVRDVEAMPAAPHWPGRFYEAATELRSWRPDIALSAWSDARAGLIAQLSGARRRIGFPMTSTNYYASEIPWRKRHLRIGQGMEHVARAAGFPLLTTALHRASTAESHMDNWQRLAGHLNVETSLETPWVTADGELPKATQDFAATQRSAGRPLWILHAGGRLPTKRWPIKRFQQLLDHFFAPREMPVLILSGPGDPCPDPTGPLQHRLLCGTHRLLAAALAAGDAILCNDSYPSHLAAALGKRVFPIFGSGNPDWFAPWKNRQNVIQKNVCPHHPCIDRCVMPSIVCLEAVTTAEAAARLQEKVET